MWNPKNGTDKPKCRNRSADIENGYVDMGGREGGGMNGISIYTLPCVKQRACGKLLYSTGSSARGSVMT